jgi:hypothetical protein
LPQPMTIDPSPSKSPAVYAKVATSIKVRSSVVQVTVVGQQLHRAALLRLRQVGTELVGSSHWHLVSVLGRKNTLARCGLARSLARRSYGQAPTFPGRSAEGRERGFTCSLNAGIPAHR